jgi:four helix bundle protein
LKIEACGLGCCEATIRGIGTPTMNNTQFRFQELEIWKRAAQFSAPVFQVADQLDKKRFFRFAEQLRAAVLSITNNIAEGSGSISRVDFANFLNTARRSTFEVANILFLLGKNGYISDADVKEIIGELEEESRMIFAFIRTLRSESKS